MNYFEDTQPSRQTHKGSRDFQSSSSSSSSLPLFFPDSSPKFVASQFPVFCSSQVRGANGTQQASPTATALPRIDPSSAAAGPPNSVRREIDPLRARRAGAGAAYFQEFIFGC